jgi:hypothetical protein
VPRFGDLELTGEPQALTRALLLAEYREIRDSANIRTREGLERLRGRIETASGECLAALRSWRLVETPTGSMMIANLEEMLAQLDDALDTLGLALEAELAGEWSAWWNEGKNQVIRFGMTTGALASILTVQSERLAFAEQNVPRLIRGVTTETRERIGRIVRQGAMLGHTRDEVYTAIEYALLGNPQRLDRGRFGGFAYQVERIYRTEAQRLYSIGQHDAAAAWEDQTGERLILIWQHAARGSLLARDWHVAMHGQAIRRGESFSNGLRFPKDPRGSAEETINCMCFTITLTADQAREQGYSVRPAGKLGPRTRAPKSQN